MGHSLESPAGDLVHELGTESEKYTLVICEKPDAARRIAGVLADKGLLSLRAKGVGLFLVRNPGELLVVCSVVGHAYSVGDPFDERTVFPVFDTEWFPIEMIEGKRGDIARRLSLVQQLSAKAGDFINACDYDIEGEVIGWNVLRYACGGRETDARRAKLSTLVENDIKEAFRSADGTGPVMIAKAGRARHLVDFILGVNLSRVLSESVLSQTSGYLTVSMGRVQGPTLGFLVEREREAKVFVPTPYWKVEGDFAVGRKTLRANYGIEKVSRMDLAKRVLNDCWGKTGKVVSLVRTISFTQPPFPFNLGDLQREAYKEFGFSPSATLQSSERLYLSALISYPRTDSQRIPPTVGYRNILTGLSKQPVYASASNEVLHSNRKPMMGPRSDPAHPAIFPTGLFPTKPMRRSDSLVYDLIVRRFLTSFGFPLKERNTSIVLEVAGHKFKAFGSTVEEAGWTSLFGKLVRNAEIVLPNIQEGDETKVTDIRLEEKFEKRPYRYTMGSLLEKMERERIGTKSTRAETISTLVKRGYVQEKTMHPTEAGFAVVETLEKYLPRVVTTDLTREIEEALEAVQSSGDHRELLRDVVRTQSDQLQLLIREQSELGAHLGRAFEGVQRDTAGLGPCPGCHIGVLRVIRSRKTGKRFVGCSNYTNGCRVSTPLPQKGSIRVTGAACPRCRYPVITLFRGRFRKRFCINMECETRRR